MAQKTRGFGFLGVGLSSVLVASCHPVEGDVPDIESTGVVRSGLFTVGTCSSDNNLAGTKDALRWNAPVSALPFLERAFRWINHANYDRSRSCNTDPSVCCNGSCGNPPTAYRTDCSGFVSHAWGLGAEPSTATLPGYGTDLGSLGNLAPGDIINRNDCGDGCNHTELFGGWMDGAKTRFCTLELYTTARPAEIRTASRSDHSAFTPLRRNGWVPWGYRTTLESDTETGLWRKCADVTGGDPVQQDCEGNDNQSWVIASVAGFGANEGFIQLKGTNSCLSPGSLNGGALVNLVACDSNMQKHRWKFDNLRLMAGSLGCLKVDTGTSPWHVKLDPGCGPVDVRNWNYDDLHQTLKITVNGMTRCMDVADGLGGTPVRAAACDGSIGQRWIRGDGGFKTALSSGRCIDASETQIKLRNCDATEPQRFALRGTIANAADTTFCLAHEAGTANGNRLNIKSCNPSDTAQLWQFWSKQ
jgi:hypothetical protein